MTLYTVHAPALPAAAEPDPAAFVFVKEGFSWPGLLIPELWLIFRRQWVVLLLYLIGLGLLLSFDAGPASWLLMLLARFLFALEANGLRRWTLERRGYRLIGVVEGHGIAEAEIRFFDGWAQPTAPAAAPPAGPDPATVATPTAPTPLPAEPVRPEPWRPTPEEGGVVGLFPAPGGTR